MDDGGLVNSRSPSCSSGVACCKTEREQMNAQMLKITDTDIADRAVKDGWRVSALANSCGVSVPTLERCFHETKGQSPREWMTAERMRRARLLLERGERIKDIAGLLCYGHQRNFATAFTAFHGYPPREHRLGKWLVNGGRTPSPKVQSPKSKVSNNALHQIRKRQWQVQIQCVELARR